MGVRQQVNCRVGTGGTRVGTRYERNARVGRSVGAPRKLSVVPPLAFNNLSGYDISPCRATRDSCLLFCVNSGTPDAMVRITSPYLPCRNFAEQTSIAQTVTRYRRWVGSPAARTTTEHGLRLPRSAAGRQVTACAMTTGRVLLIYGGLRPHGRQVANERVARRVTSPPQPRGQINLGGRRVCWVWNALPRHRCPLTLREQFGDLDAQRRNSHG